MRQSYICDQCGVESHVDLGEDANFYEAVRRIRSDHHKWSPECATTKVQISNAVDPVRRYYVELGASKHNEL